MNPSDAAPALPRLRALLSDPEVRVRTDALRALGRHGDEFALDVAKAALFDPNGWYRAEAAPVVRDLGDAETARWLAEKWLPLREYERARLLPLLVRHEPAVAASRADELMQPGSTPFALAASLDALAALSDPRAFEYARHLALHRNYEVRRAAVRVLARAVEANLSLLGELALDTDRGVARAAQLACAPHANDARLAVLMAQLGADWASGINVSLPPTAHPATAPFDVGRTGVAAQPLMLASPESTEDARTNTQNGVIVDGVIKAVMDYGLFVRTAVATFDAFVHVTDIPPGAPLVQRFRVGQSMQARVLSHTALERHLQLGIVQIDEDPWADPACRNVSTSLRQRISEFTEAKCCLTAAKGARLLVLQVG